ncbi:DUF3379 family protein [Rheinheimera sp. MMS21-TC3]|uniref:DUF3379 family protein n=1 Tax=Rheinheimera sp. MMS21-TC3 TaxID=3072790 RepID=UPI0028C4FCB9|nr:DUF3379 family protein [Rheinheimera sp. MMS21-TC3]WNO62058.1 DUF3379 family protein [Rheinheimera sp. MMS21-TC3]
MNNFKLRQQLEQEVLQNPNSTHPQVINLMQQDAEFKSFVSNIRLQDQALQQALKLPLPAEVSTELLQIPNQPIAKTTWLTHLAIAASFVALSLISAVIYKHYTPSSMAEHALAHIHNEVDFVNSHLAQQSLSDVNSKLASFNASLENWSDDIIYARFCHFKGVRSLHLAIRTSTGYATVFIVPKETKLNNNQHFSDADYQGIELAMAQANLVIVSREAADLNLLSQKLLANLRFST